MTKPTKKLEHPTMTELSRVMRARLGEMDKFVTDVAKATGISRITIHAMLRGQDCKISTIAKVAEYLGINTIQVVKSREK